MFWFFWFLTRWIAGGKDFDNLQKADRCSSWWESLQCTLNIYIYTPSHQKLWWKGRFWWVGWAYIYIYIYIYTMCTYIYIYIYIYILCVYIYIYYVYVYIYREREYVYEYRIIHVYIYIYTYKYTWPMSQQFLAVPWLSDGSGTESRDHLPQLSETLAEHLINIAILLKQIVWPDLSPQLSMD